MDDKLTPHVLSEWMVEVCRFDILESCSGAGERLLVFELVYRVSFERLTYGLINIHIYYYYYILLHMYIYTYIHILLYYIHILILYLILYSSSNIPRQYSPSLLFLPSSYHSLTSSVLLPIFIPLFPSVLSSQQSDVSIYLLISPISNF